MRFRRIQIPAFGPFTDFGLELPSQGGDFHLVYGPNEAGKSSMLRTLRSFLFGIDAQTSDGFLHDYKKLLITAELEKRDGTVATFQRRKGNKNTLLDAQGTPLADTALGEYLGGIDRAYFESMFGMGSTELRQGAAALLKGEGRLGELLFSASLGGTPVDKVIRGLEDEAATIFKGRAIGSIRATKRLLDESVKGAKEALMKPELWEEADRALTELLGEIGTLAAGKSALVDRRAWLERCRDALPISGQYRDALEQLTAVADLPALREDFAREIREARLRWTAAEDRLAPLGIQLTALQAQRAACELAPEILERKAEIHRLHYGVGLYRERTVTLGKKQLEQAQLKGRMDGLCQELEIATPLADLEALRISQARLLAVEQAAGALEDAGQMVAAAEKAATVLAGEIAVLEGQVTSAHGDVAGLQAAVDRTARFEELANGLATRTTKAAVELKRLDSLRVRLPGAPGDLKALRALELPLKSTVEGFRDGFDTLDRRAETLAAEQAEAKRKVAELTTEIERRSRQKNLPSVQDLDEARTRREQGWSRVLREWQAGEEPLSTEPLETAYPALVKSADEIADRLRLDAEDVAQLEEKRLQRTDFEAAAEQAALGLAKISEEKLVLTARWWGVGERAGLTGLMPREMAEWITGWEDFSRPWDFYEEARSRLDDDLAAVEAATVDLAAFFPDERAATLPVLLTKARSLIAAHHQEVGANREVLRQLEAKKSALRQVQSELPGQRQALTALGESWQADALALGIPAGLRPQGALGLLRARVTLFAEFDRWRAASAEASVLGQGIADFEKEVADLVQALGRPSQGTESDVAHLWDSAAKAESAGEKARLLSEQIDAKTQDQELVRAESARSQQQFGALLKEAGLADQGGLAAFLLKIEERSRCTAQLATVRQLLAGLARGEALEDFVAKVRAEGEAGLMGALDAVNGEIATLESQIETRQAARQSWLTQRAGLEAASDAAATHQQQAELSLATLRRDAERFARLQLGISLLKARIDRFREQNQGPFMEKAGRWFAEITGGDFAGISAVFDAGDQPVLAGVRAGEGESRMLEIAGMSEGTQDQLFLALRLAGLEMHPPEQEPLPLILDDLLVHFDDRRATSALQALHSFGARSQVILFTHHRHLVELATKQLGSAGLHLHRLRD